MAGRAPLEFLLGRPGEGFEGLGVDSGYHVLEKIDRVFVPQLPVFFEILERLLACHEAVHQIKRRLFASVGAAQMNHLAGNEIQKRILALDDDQ